MRSASSERPELSAVVTCYFEEKSIDEFYSRLRATLEKTGRSFEILLVNDGSTDGTLEHLRSIHARDTHVTVIDLFRNAGQACAMTAAIERGRGRAVVFIDSDLQLDPEDLPLLLSEYDQGADVVSGARRERQDPLARRVFSSFANRTLRRMTRTQFTDFGCTFKVFRADLIRAFEFGPKQPFNPVYVIRSAGRTREVLVTHHPRRYGRSGWTLRKLWTFYLDNLLGYSEGTFQALSALAFAAALLTLVRIALAWVFPASVLAVVTTGLILNALLLSMAVLLGVLGLLGEYVIRLHNRESWGPRYVVREVLAARGVAESPAP
jgi:glycosyltransferase involved in cell wall biosynthesis